MDGKESHIGVKLDATGGIYDVDKNDAIQKQDIKGEFFYQSKDTSFAHSIYKLSVKKYSYSFKPNEDFTEMTEIPNEQRIVHAGDPTVTGMER